MKFRLLPEEIRVTGEKRRPRIPFASGVVEGRRCTVLRDSVSLGVKQMVQRVRYVSLSELNVRKIILTFEISDFSTASRANRRFPFSLERRRRRWRQNRSGCLVIEKV